MINSIFYILLFLFIWNEFYYVRNRNKLATKFRDRAIESYTLFDVVYYLTRVFYWFWLIIGCFSHLQHYFQIIILLSLGKFILYHLNKKIYAVYDLIIAIVSIVTLILLFVDRFIS